MDDKNQEPRGSGDSREDGRGGTQWELAGRLLTIGIEFVLSIVLGMVLGYGFDRLMGTRPVGLFAGLFIGIAAAFRGLFRLAARLRRDR